MAISTEAQARHRAEVSRRSRAIRAGWLVAGLLLIAVGFVGIFVPLLPTTDFLLLALPCFARSSPRLEAWLLDHPRFGASIRAWREKRAILRRAKVMACLGMTVGYVLFILHVRPSLPWAIGLGFVMLFWAIWITRRPEPASPSGKSRGT
ncbi:YbaN family protein [Sphingobium yanoikuyae]|uniref:DUF454 domain-containing protein n=1 Tax=Sphingobium yanoikuyae TaxID=13690 RepID=A0A291MZV9_SPHYA|nr:YbaN family protein [Sphingobium yanoikuyae]ATI80485.1 hypothetical protein A6768_11050 [Sphingobium yanoikuyae]